MLHNALRRITSPRTSNHKHQLLQLLSAPAVMLPRGGELRLQCVQERPRRRVSHGVVARERKRGHERGARRVRERRAQRVQRAHSLASRAKSYDAEIANLKP